MSESWPEGLAKKLGAARKDARTVKKTGTSGDGTYKFAQAEDVAKEARRVLRKHGIAVVPAIPSATHKFGDGGALVKADMLFDIIDVDTGESVQRPWVAAGFDNPGDKAINQAATVGAKYFVAGLLGMPFGADPEVLAPVSISNGALAGRAPEIIDGLRAARIRREQDSSATAPDAPGVTHG